MQDDKLAADEARRQMQHDAIKSQVESDVNSEIATRADRTTRIEARQMEQVAGEMRGKAINEVAETEREVERSRGLARVSQVVDYIFYVIYALLAVRLLLALLAARSSAGFVQFIRSVTDPLYAPFRGIVGSPSIEGGYTLALPIVIAIIVYALVHAGINGLLRLVAHRKTAI
ncbi:MAG: YggT family protein [Pyrinomonadaceae bacterium]|nr:YggT family protein [Pyrinomonadaceae bacterium]MDQ3135383.1 YggT family protein [Acidobacteriota bacterium]